VTIVETGTTRIAVRQTVLPSRMMRFCPPLLAVFALAAGLCGGCQGSGGAVSVRWRIVELSTGEAFDPGATGQSGVVANHGYCCRLRDANSDCTAGNAWVVQTVGIVLRDAATDAFLQDVSPFNCTARERTTRFDLPAGSFAIGLEASVVDGAGKVAPVALPPSEVRTIVRGEVVNLQVIEIGVHPLPLPGPVPLPGPPSMVTF
jgi:hypothetical protein